MHVDPKIAKKKNAFATSAILTILPGQFKKKMLFFCSFSSQQKNILCIPNKQLKSKFKK
jgi:hypothetical protein